MRGLANDVQLPLRVDGRLVPPRGTKRLPYPLGNRQTVTTCNGPYLSQFGGVEDYLKALTHIDEYILLIHMSHAQQPWPLTAFVLANV